jgi:hypothetical protein
MLLSPFLFLPAFLIFAKQTSAGLLPGDFPFCVKCLDFKSLLVLWEWGVEPLFLGILFTPFPSPRHHHCDKIPMLSNYKEERFIYLDHGCSNQFGPVVRQNFMVVPCNLSELLT